MDVDIQRLKELRDKTGLSVMQCKAALAETKGDITKAIEWLKRQGVALAEKKKDKVTRTGRIGTYVHTNNRVGVLVELNCETDFVANNEEFQELLKDLCLQVAAMNPMTVSREQIPSEIINKEKDFYRATIKNKPPEIIDKIVEGKLEKFFYSQKCLLEQPFIRDDTIKIKDLIKTKIAKFGENITVKRFVRFEIGNYE